MTTRGSVEPSAAELVDHLGDRYGVAVVDATQLGVHNDRVFRVDLESGGPWLARVYPSSRPHVRVDGDAAILRYLEQQGFPAERLVAGQGVSDIHGSCVLVTGFVDGLPLPDGVDKITMLGDLLGRLHALPLDGAIDRPGGAAGDEPGREGGPVQDQLAALELLESVEAQVAPAAQDLLDGLRAQVQAVDVGDGLPEALVHGNLLHNPDHALLTETGPVAINWRASGRGPRLADVAYLLWGAEWGDGNGVEAAVAAYRRHVELSKTELERLEAVMYVRPLYLACLDFQRAVANGEQPTGSEWWWGLIDPEHIRTNAAAARAALRR